MQNNLKNPRNTIGIGYLIVPVGVNVEDFTKSCFNKEQFYVLNNDGEVLTNVPATSQVLNNLQLPENSNLLGSQVLYVNFFEHNKPVIIATLSQQGVSEFRSNGDFKLSNEASGDSIGISGNSFSSKLSLFVKAVKNKAAKIFIRTEGGNSDSIIDISSLGKLILQAKEGFRAKNGKREISIDKEKILLADGKHKILMTDEGFTYSDGVNTLKVDKDGYHIGNINFQSFMSDLLSMLSDEISVMTPMGPSTPGCKTQTPKVTTLLQEINKINN